ncbi:MAG: arylsulfatase [Gammaproteobacteria bacterium]|nr:arylsulfatase [Gammaproteobacteria bacterium]
MKRRQFLQLSAAVTATITAPVPRAARSADDDSAALSSAWRPRQGIRKPNIVIAVLDDVGFGDLGCYGAEHQTNAIDSLAKTGIRFNNFHVTALCAPTRACLLTGRNAHAVGVGNIAEWGRDHPGYHGWIRNDAATLAEYLRPEAYTTLATGKWHLSAIHDQNGSGPYDHWPVGRGFDRWYGFHGNAMDHWHPEMFENTVAAYPKKDADYHLSTDLVDRSIDYIEDHLAATPENPFFLYLAFGACHFPLHAPADDIRRHRGRYDAGWDEIRRQRFKRQQQIGIFPADTKLAPRNPNVPAWSDLSDEQRKLAARGQEVYAAFLEHTDHQLARLIEFLKSEDQFHDTILIVMSDNGAAGGGGSVEGILDVRRVAYYEKETLAELVEHFNALGSDDSYGMYSSGWAQAGNTPLKWYKADTYGGGTRAPLIVSWPNGEIGSGQINSQYHHVIDIAPSLFEMINKPATDTIKNQTVLPIQGTSFAYSFDSPNAPTNKKVQYFETAGDRAIWMDGWKAVTKHVAGDEYDNDVWELYQTDRDFSEIDNLAAGNPERLSNLVELWHREARRDNVLPMEDDLLRLYEEVVPKPRPRYTFYPGMARLDRLSAPDIHTYGGKLSANVVLHNKRAQGVILASGDSGAGYEMFMQDGYLVFVYVYTRFERYTLRSPKRVASGQSVLGLAFIKTGDNSADVSMLINDAPVASMQLPKMWQVFAPNSGIRCGENRHAPISRAYDAPFVFDQKLLRVIVELDL